MLRERRKPFRVRLHILLIVELLRHDHVEHGVEHRHVGTVAELQHVRGVALERLAARIRHHQCRAALGRLFEKRRGDRMIFGRVGADDDDDFGILALIKGRRHRGRTDALHQSGDRRGVAQARTMIDIVGAEAGAHQLLEQIGFLIGSFG